MYIHEYQAKALLSARGVAVPAGRVAQSPEQAGRAYEELHVPKAMVKAQVHAGGRGKAGGILPAASRAEAEAAARKLLGTTLVTRQTGPRGRLVGKALVEEALDVRTELYLSLTLDRSEGRPLMIASARGGKDIEEIGRAEPGAIFHEPGDPFTGLAPFQARKLAAALGLDHSLLKPMTAAILALGSAFIAYDCSLIELNPLAVCSDGRLVAADVKMSFDDNALSRHPQIADLCDTSQEDPREVEAQRDDLSYVGLQGTIGCMVNGAGLAMATMDLLRLHGGDPILGTGFVDILELFERDEETRAVVMIGEIGGTEEERAAAFIRSQMTKPVVLEPLLSLGVVKDLIVDQGPFFASIRTILPWLTQASRGARDPLTFDASMDPTEKDQFLRSTDCIMCQSCFSDCPKRRQDPRFEGPATCLAIYKRIHHPQAGDAAERLKAACRPGGVFDCGRHANCVKVCPKGCRPMRAIMMLQRRAKNEGLAPE